MILNPSKVYDQPPGGDCVVYSLVGCCDILGVYLDPSKIVKELSDIKGAGIHPQTGLKHFKNKGYIGGYEKVNTSWQIKRSIDQGCPVMATSHLIDFIEIFRSIDKVAVLKKVNDLKRHNWFIRGYDNKKMRFICRNSEGIKWGDNGDFYLPYRMLNNIGQCYKIIGT